MTFNWRKDSGQQRFKLQRKKGSRAGVNIKERFFEKGDLRAFLHNGLTLGGEKLSEHSVWREGENTLREPTSSGRKWVCSLLPFIAPSSSVLFCADMERTRKAQRRLGMAGIKCINTVAFAGLRAFVLLNGDQG